jgi:hypothetical protein
VNFRSCFLLILHSVVMYIWSPCNNVVFSGKTLDIKQLVDKIQHISW